MNATSSSRITAVSRLTPRVTAFRFMPSRPFAYMAGQHVDVRLTAPDGYTAQRSYSIASAPEAGDEIELAIEKLEDGEVSVRGALGQPRAGVEDLGDRERLPRALEDLHQGTAPRRIPLADVAKLRADDDVQIRGRH